MQIKIYTIPVDGQTAAVDEMNVFLRSHKVLSVDSQLAMQGTAWTFCIRYIDGDVPAAGPSRGEKVDYREVLTPEQFAAFSVLREARKAISAKTGLPAFAVFTDAELSEIAKVNPLNEQTMKQVKGIGNGRIERFGKPLLDFIAERNGPANPAASAGASAQLAADTQSVPF